MVWSVTYNTRAGGCEGVSLYWYLNCETMFVLLRIWNYILNIGELDPSQILMLNDIVKH